MHDSHPIPPFPTHRGRSHFPLAVRAYLELIRLPNVFTALADVTMGYVVTHAFVERPTLSPFLHFGLLVGTSGLLYLAGTVLNDVFDAESDAHSRPERPIPSGRVSRQIAGLIGWEFLICGMACAWLASFFSGDWRPGIIGSLLAGCILSYDGIMKKNPLGPFIMGTCRSLNVLLGMSLVSLHVPGVLFGWSVPCWIIAAGIGLYVYGLTLIAKRETHETDRTTAAGVGCRLGLVTGTLVLFGGIALLACLPHWVDPIAITVGQWSLLWGILTAFVGWRCLRAILHPRDIWIRAAVGHAIVSIIFLDAAIAAGLCGPFWGLVILTLAVPAILLRPWFEST
ncbi:MAG: UbiA family prenyltransferase [Pirellulales bacterium]|nr:UbiA family prenyltransferase [Pirellulales bacterium]